MANQVIKNILKLTMAGASVLLLFLVFSSESITFSVPNSITEFSTFMDSQAYYKTVETESEGGYYQSQAFEAYERQFLVDQARVNLSIKKYETVQRAQEIYDLLKHQNVIKMTFDIDGNSYIRFKIGNINYCAWHNQETVVVIKSENRQALQNFKNYIIKAFG